MTVLLSAPIASSIARKRTPAESDPAAPTSDTRAPAAATFWATFAAPPIA
jgi:hypothetical protein